MSQASQHFLDRIDERAIKWEEVQACVADGSRAPQRNGHMLYSLKGLRVVQAQDGSLITAFTAKPRTPQAVASHPLLGRVVGQFFKPLLPGLLVACDFVPDPVSTSQVLNMLPANATNMLAIWRRGRGVAWLPATKTASAWPDPKWLPAALKKLVESRRLAKLSERDLLNLSAEGDSSNFTVLSARPDGIYMFCDGYSWVLQTGWDGCSEDEIKEDIQRELWGAHDELKRLESLADPEEEFQPELPATLGP